MQKEYRNDRAWLTVDVEADLRSVFHWNTKQVSPLQSSALSRFLKQQLYQACHMNHILEAAAMSRSELVSLRVHVQAFVYITADFKTAQNAVNEVMIWSRIVQEKGNANVRELVRLEYPYALTDPSKNPSCPGMLLQRALPCLCVLCNHSLRPANTVRPRYLSQSTLGHTWRAPPCSCIVCSLALRPSAAP